jgi:hypothetical protein
VCRAGKSRQSTYPSTQTVTVRCLARAGDASRRDATSGDVLEHEEAHAFDASRRDCLVAALVRKKSARSPQDVSRWSPAANGLPSRTRRAAELHQR